MAAQARIEIGLEKFLEDGNYQAIVTHFGMLGRTEAASGAGNSEADGKGYGFGGEGD